MVVGGGVVEGSVLGVWVGGVEQDGGGGKGVGGGEGGEESAEFGEGGGAGVVEEVVDLVFC